MDGGCSGIDLNKLAGESPSFGGLGERLSEVKSRFAQISKNI